jgi:hypothetical protein
MLGYPASPGERYAAIAGTIRKPAIRAKVNFRRAKRAA